MKSRIKNDLILLITVIIVAVVGIAVGNFWKSPGSTVLISLNSSTYAEVPLSQDAEIDVDGILTVMIDGGEVYVCESTCPDGLCESMGKISESGESIVCLPNGVVVRITSDEPEYDFIN